MFLSDTNGSKTKALEYFSKKFFQGLADSDRQFRQFIRKKGMINMGKSNGDTFTVSIIGDLPLVGSIAENVETTAVNPTIDKVSVTVKEYASKIEYTNKLKNIAELPIEDIFRNKLAQQAARSLDKVAHDEVFAVANLTATPSSATALTWEVDGTTAGNSLYNLTLDHVLAISSYIRANRIPLKDGKIYCVASPTVLEPIKKELTSINQHTESGFLRFVKGVVGEVYGVVFVEENNVNSTDAYFFGDEVGLEVVVEPEHIVIGTETDIGRFMEIGWRYTGAFSKITDNRVVKFVGKD